MATDEIDFEEDQSSEAALGRLIDQSVEMGASDLMLLSEETEVVASVRHLGMVSKISAFPIEEGQRLIRHVKVLAGMDLTERRRPLDGRWVVRRDDGQRVDVRASSLPTVYGEDVCLRIMDGSSQRKSIAQLGLSEPQLQRLEPMLQSPSGLVLVTGPTGSGKTTTLYSFLDRLNDGTRKINTIEDPVEYRLPGVRQSQVQPAIELGFSDILRSVLRQAPDVIMIGEIRDNETATTAVRAANSGHLVFATLHAPIASAAVQSMLALGVLPHFLSTSLLGVVSQRLVRSLCPECRVRIDLSGAPQVFEDIKGHIPKDRGQEMYAAGRCDRCHQVGYGSRVGVFEVMTMSPRLRDATVEMCDTRLLNEIAAEEGMISLRQSALLHVANGLTSVEEVFRTVPTEFLGLDGVSL
jgi:type II secretory ATPase GspE/PulE/Tfp pilus assembly ATPase PilB-like protein